VNARQRLIVSLLILAGVFVGGTTGYMLLDGASAGDAAYMTLITLSTVGYHEVIELDRVGRLWTSAIIVFGIGAVSVAFTSLVTLFVGGEVRAVLGRRKVQSKIDHLSGHAILCGFGRMGAMAVDKLKDRGTEVVVVERKAALQPEIDSLDLLYVIGDATEEATLQAAGLQQARALVTVLPTDADNVFVTLTARGLHQNLHIVARAEQPRTEAKLRSAGADRVICPQVIGARRIADILTRPNVVDFFEIAARGVELEMDEYRVERGSVLEGKTLRDAALRQATGAMVVAIMRAEGTSVYQPGPEEVIRTGDTLILIGRTGSSTRLEQFNG